MSSPDIDMDAQWDMTTRCPDSRGTDTLCFGLDNSMLSAGMYNGRSLQSRQAGHGEQQPGL